MNNITNKEKEILELIHQNPYLEQEELAIKLGISRSSVAGHLARLIKKGIIKRGYIFAEKTNEIAVIGGANVDIKGIPDTLFRHYSSNPGSVYKSAGGVGRNVAENLGRLQLTTSFYSVVGDDYEGKWLLEYTSMSGVNIDHVIKLSDKKTGQYISLLNDEKDLIGSVADMDIMDSLDNDVLDELLPYIKKTKMIFIDTNLSREAIQYLIEFAKKMNITTVIDPVSAKKSVKLEGLLNNIDVFTPNKEEAEILSGIPINSPDELNNVTDYFLDLGVKNLIITLGEDGVYVANSNNQVLLSSPKIDVKDTTGAGDAFVAGVIYALNKDLDIFEASMYGIALASITLKREESVATDLSKILLENTRKKML